MKLGLVVYNYYKQYVWHFSLHQGVYLRCVFISAFIGDQKHEIISKAVNWSEYKQTKLEIPRT